MNTFCTSLIFHISTFLTFSVFIFNFLSVSEGLNCTNVTGAVDSPKVSVTNFYSIKNELIHDVLDATEVSSLKLNCSSSQPIEWTFQGYPDTKKWNVSYSRKTDHLHNSSYFQFYSILDYWDLSLRDVKHSEPVCHQIADHCLRTGINVINTKGVIEITPTSVNEDLNKSGTGNTKEPPCTLSFNFNENKEEFYCSVFNSSIAPNISFIPCSNPTECGIYTKRENCWSLPEQTSQQCEIDENCSLAKANSSFPHGVAFCSIPITDSQKEVKIHEYFYITSNSSNNTGKFYSNWKEVTSEKPTLQLRLEQMDNIIFAGDKFNVTCIGEYYLFAEGFHISIKHNTGSAWTYDVSINTDENEKIVELELTSPDRKNYFHTFNESIEYSKISSAYSEPISRVMKISNFFLPSGEYEFICYAPVWNSNDWVTKSTSITVIETALPVFLDGARDRKMEYEPLQNITCVAKGEPVPKVRWMNQEIADNKLVKKDIPDQVMGNDSTHSWSKITLPIEMVELYDNYICQAENRIGFIEKRYHIQRADPSADFMMKIAAIVVVVGFSISLVILCMVYKYIFAKGKTHIPCL